MDMTVESLKRVVWRLQEKFPEGKFSRVELDRAIMLECGTHRQTISGNKKSLIKLGWIKRNNYKFQITDAFATGDPDW